MKVLNHNIALIIFIHITLQPSTQAGCASAYLASCFPWCAHPCDPPWWGRTFLVSCQVALWSPASACSLLYLCITLQPWWACSCSRSELVAGWSSVPIAGSFGACGRRAPPLVALCARADSGSSLFAFVSPCFQASFLCAGPSPF